MDYQKSKSSNDATSASGPRFAFSNKVQAKAQFREQEGAADFPVVDDVDVDLREIYFLIMQFLSAGPCQKSSELFWNELLEHQLLPRRYHAWYSRTGANSIDDTHDGISFPLDYDNLVERYSHLEKDHLVKLLKKLLLSTAPPRCVTGRNAPTAADVPTLLGTGSFSLLTCSESKTSMQVNPLPAHLRWPHMQADQVRGLSLREIGGGFPKHHRAPSARFACYAIAKPSTMVQKMQNIKKLRGHRNAVYCAIFDRSGRYVITGSDDRLVKIWSMETAFCLSSCRGHEGDITDLAVSSNNALVASASNDYSIRVWRLPDGLPISVLRGHIGAVTAIAFSPRPSSVYQLLSSSDDGTCRIWDARYSQCSPRIYLPNPTNGVAGKSNGPPLNNGTSSSNAQQSHQILCCAYNANGTVFVTGSSDTFARVWSAYKSNRDESEKPNYEIDVLAGHENDVNYVQFSSCAVASRSGTFDTFAEERIPKFKNSWFSHDNIVTCSRDGSAIIWIPRTRRSPGKIQRWTRAYHLKVPPPPIPPQLPRGGPRQRFLPTPRGVNMIVWSLDNRFVLAAIMDCRICVWNASDGSLVHSLTGHSASTYVLDVHPLNPRIAMSAGYDGKTIVWDIWEGTPIRTYEIGRFKLVDGKFSPDGTSIVLSDDVGQIYLLNTGQGESQKDAKYDQFFLGDYCPFVQDTHGNVLDQETQLVTYRRNIQDPLCDSSLLPYPEPYQSMFQRRRLGALGIEWNPSSIKYTIGNDTGLAQEHPLLPLADLDIPIEPLPEFIDAMYWEPENDVLNDDNDSEYNITDEYISEDEQGSLSDSSSSYPEHGEGKQAERSQKDILCKSKRKIPKTAEGELKTSSGRLVKRRNLDEHTAMSSRTTRTKSSRNGRKNSKRKSSKVKTLRPQRAAARNATNFLSQIVESSTDGEDQDDSEDESLELLQHSDTRKPKESLLNVKQKYSKNESLFLDVVKPPQCVGSQTNNENRRRLVLKFSIRNSKNSVVSEISKTTCDNRTTSAPVVSGSFEETPKDKKIIIRSKDPGSCSTNIIDADHNEKSSNTFGDGLDKVDENLEVIRGCQDAKVSRAEVKVCSSKLMMSADLLPMDSCTQIDETFVGHFVGRTDVKGPGKLEHDNEIFSASAIQNRGCNLLSEAYRDEEKCGMSTSQGTNVSRRSNFSPEDEQKYSSYDPSLQQGSASGVSLNQYLNEGCEDSDSDACRGHELLLNLKVNPPKKPTKLRIKSKKNVGETEITLKPKLIAPVDGPTGPGDDLMSEIPSFEEDLMLGVPETDESSARHIIIQRLLSDSSAKLDDGAYARAKSHRSWFNPEDYVGETKEVLQASRHDLEAKRMFPEPAIGAVHRRTRSVRLKATSSEANVNVADCNSPVREEDDHVSGLTLRSSKKSSRKAIDCISSEVLTSKSIRSRSTRNRGDGSFGNDPSCKAKPHAARKSNWLLMPEQEQGYRYIPQLGDEVVYLRQGHQEFLDSSCSSVEGPWISAQGNIRAVEICLVDELNYATLPGSGESCCKLVLKFIDTESSLFGDSFKLTLPELVNFSDFIVERTQYDAAIRRSWAPRDKCLVWWGDGSEDGGRWWEGRIMSSKDKSSEFPGSPWERYDVQYRKSTENQLHSPWELHDPDSRWEQPRIDPRSRDKMLSCLAELEHSANRNQDMYGIVKLKLAAQKSDFINRFPVPLCPQIIEARLENDYYRSLEALEHDISVLLSNAQVYFAKNRELSSKMKHLRDWFSGRLLKL